MTTAQVNKETQSILSKSKFQEIPAVFGRQYILSALLPNGFVITETMTYLSEEEYDENEAKQAVMLKIMDRISEYVTYANA